MSIRRLCSSSVIPSSAHILILTIILAAVPAASSRFETIAESSFGSFGRALPCITLPNGEDDFVW